MRVIGYVRVSTKDQAEGGVSLEAQRSKLEAYAALYDLEIIRIEEDAGLSAKNLDRPGLQSALDSISSGEADGLLIAKLDRLSRSVVDMANLVRDVFGEKGSLISVADQIDTSSANGRLILNILTTLGEWEREIIAERTKAALDHLKASGVRLGATPFGDRRVSGSTEEGRMDWRSDETEREAIDFMHFLRKRGYSFRAIGRRLEKEGYQTKRGSTKWQPTTIKRIMQRTA